MDAAAPDCLSDGSLVAIQFSRVDETMAEPDCIGNRVGVVVRRSCVETEDGQCETPAQPHA